MTLPQDLIEGRLLRRYKRFFADVEMPDGQVVTAHCPNTGSMRNCCEPGSRVWLTRSNNPKRKLAYTWELVETAPGELACVNTSRPNHQVRAAIEAARIPELSGYSELASEVRYGEERSRIDLKLSGHGDWPDAWVEVKNVTLCEGGIGFFPDAVTSRGQKHLRELAAQVKQGDRAVLMFCVNHTGITEVRPADGIDPVYSRLLREVAGQGVEVLAWQADLARNREPAGAFDLVRPVPVRL